MRRTVSLVVAAVLLAALAAGCLGGGREAQATLHRTTDFGVRDETSGYANLTQRGDQVTVRVEVWGLEPGPKGTHIHQNGSCRNAFVDGGNVRGGAAGGHFNPGNASHPGHAGDLGNMEVNDDGRGVLEVRVREIHLGADGPWSVIGRAVVVHGGEDDLESEPAGNAGPRVLCGVIAAQ